MLEAFSISDTFNDTFDLEKITSLTSCSLICYILFLSFWERSVFKTDEKGEPKPLLTKLSP
jgi:hypothetical protein